MQTKPLWEIVDILDNQRIPISWLEREKRISWKSQDQLFPYYGATQQNGRIDDYIFDEELILLWEDGVLFYDADKPKAYMVNGKYWVNNHAHVLRAKEWIAINAYICYYLNTFDYHGYVTGATRLKLTQSSMKTIPIPLPDLPTQQAIAAKLDAIQTLIDDKKQAIVKTDELAKSIFIDMFGDPVTNEKGWEVKNIWTLISDVSNIKIDRLKDIDINYIDISSVDNIQKEIIGYKEMFWSNAPSRAKQILQKWDILLSTVRPNLNAVAIVNLDKENLIWSTWFCVLRSDENKLSNIYLFQILKSAYFINSMMKVAKGASYPAVTDRDIKNFKFPLPPLPLQQQFAAAISQLQQVQDDNKLALTKLEELFAATMQECFS